MKNNKKDRLPEKKPSREELLALAKRAGEQLREVRRKQALDCAKGVAEADRIINEMMEEFTEMEERMLN